MTVQGNMQLDMHIRQLFVSIYNFILVILIISTFVTYNIIANVASKGIHP